MSATAATEQDLYGLRGVVFLWFPIVGPIAAWTVHLLFIISFARYSCTEPGTAWTIHLVTAVCLAVAGLGTFLGWRLTRTTAGEGTETVGGRHLFLGRLALICGALNLTVIGLEELYAIGFHSVRCV